MDFDKLVYGVRASMLVGGLVGNIIVFVVFTRPSFGGNSASIYCRALAIADCYLIYQLIVDLALLFSDYDMAAASWFGCQFTEYVLVGLSSIPGWILVAFSLDKLFSTHNTLQFERPTNRRIFQWSLIVAIALFNLILYSGVFFFSRKPSSSPSSSTNCSMNSLLLGQAMTPVYLIQGVLVPFFVIMLASTLLVHSVQEASARASSATTTTAAQSLEVKSAAAISYSVGSSRRRARDLRSAYTSLGFNFVHAVLKLPLVLCLVVFNYDVYVPSSAYIVASFFFFLTSCLNIFVHYVSNTLFRREILKLFHLRRNNRVRMVQRV